MHEHLIAQLKTLNAIAPDEGFARCSRTLILAGAPARPSLAPWFQVAGALAFAALLLFISPLFPSAQPVLSSSLDPQHLTGEFNGLSVNLQLDEVRYQQNANLTINSAMNEITDTRTQHLNPATLSAENPTSSSADDHTSEHIDALLESVTQ